MNHDHVDTSTHRPLPPPTATKGVTDACVAACQTCATACLSCADACLTEDPKGQADCIRLNQDCAALCRTTGEILARGTISDGASIHALLTACASMCAACATECEKHAGHMAHCKRCAEACRACETACRAALAA